LNYASDKESAHKVVTEIKETGRNAVAVQGDMSKQADVVKLFQETLKEFGGFDVLVNNAGIYEFALLE
jgi:3-oxoacyl-[acyl-carrier protein] reductase